MSRPGRDFDSDYDVEDDEEPSSAESDDSYDPEMPSTPKARRRPAAPPPRPRKKRRRRRAVAASSSSDSDGGGPRTLYCALCRRDVHEDSFSAAVKRGDYGKHMTEPFCLAHSAGDQRRYALRPAREDTSDSDSDGDGDGVSRGLAGGRLAANLLARHGLESDEDVVMADGDDDALDRAETILETGRGRLRGANRRLRFDDDDEEEEEEEAAAPAAPEPDDDDDDDDGGGDASSARDDARATTRVRDASRERTAVARAVRERRPRNRAVRRRVQSVQRGGELRAAARSRPREGVGAVRRAAIVRRARAVGGGGTGRGRHQQHRVRGGERDGVREVGGDTAHRERFVGGAVRGGGASGDVGGASGGGGLGVRSRGG